MIKELFSILSIFDFFSPIITVYKDITHLFTVGTPTQVLWLDKYDIGLAMKVLDKKGIKVISWTMVPQDREGGITIESAQIGLIKLLLSNAGIETW